MEKFYNLHEEKLLRYLTRHLGTDDGSEVFSQVFEEFFAWWPAHPEHANPVAVLYRTARCRVTDHLRRARPQPTEDEALAEALARALSGGHGELAHVVERMDIRSALADLSGREQQALVLRYELDLPVKECAEILGVRMDNMKKILKVALHKLRRSPRMDGYRIVGTAKEARR
ncbi:sigma-70 family RNA polymerase sigma factor [Streptomyces sp. NPDC004549]|uniref:RNA polymerase sigma factor n=1 Tax=Streptomyces sp. NPDC004549 TaxID=3154283 RepID=UPI0033AE5D11